MATEILMPQMGESIAEGTITRWLAKVGDTIERDAPLLEISTDKVDSEIPSPASGVLLEIRHQEDETVEVGEVLGRIGAEGESVGQATAASAPATELPAATDAPPAGAGGAGEAVVDRGDMDLGERLRRFSSPLVRKIAAEENVDITAIEGSGIHGRVTKKDILAYLDRRAAGEVVAAAAPSAPPPRPAAAAAPASGGRPVPSGFSVPAYGASENVVVEPMDRIRQRTADHMVYSKATSAHVTTVFHVDMSKVARLRQRVKSAFQRDVGTKLTYMPFIFRAVCDGIRQHPQMNAAIDGRNIVFKKDVHLGMAVALDGGGLIVPVLRHADEKNVIGLARTANDLADRARSKKLKPDEAVGGTFTITNPGVFGSLFGTPIINQPQVAILGIGTIEKRAIVVTDEDGIDALAIRTMAYFALTFDHRLIDGADADAFMNVVKSTLEAGDFSELSSYL